MNDFAATWRFTRVRLNEATRDLSAEQMGFRMHEQAHTMFELLYHIAGAEHYWAARLSGRDPAPNDYEAKLDAAVKDGFLRDGGCPFGAEEMTIPLVSAALEYAARELGEVLDNLSAEQRAMTLISPIGDEVTGEQGLARIAQHAGYHTGQIWLLRMHPSFPR